MNIYKTIYYRNDEKVLSSVVAYDFEEAKAFVAQRQLNETFEGLDGDPTHFQGEFMPPDTETVLDQARFMCELSLRDPDAPPLVRKSLEHIEYAIKRIETGKESRTSVQGLWDFAYEALVYLRERAPGVSKKLARSEPPMGHSVSARDFIDTLVLEYDNDGDRRKMQECAKCTLAWFEGIKEAMKVSSVEIIFTQPGKAGQDLDLDRTAPGVLEAVEALDEALSRIEKLSLHALVGLTTWTLFIREHESWRALVQASYDETLRRGEPEKRAEALFGRLLK